MQKVGKISSQPHTFIVHAAIHGSAIHYCKLKLKLFFLDHEKIETLGNLLVNGIPFGLLFTLKKVRKRFDPCE